MIYQELKRRLFTRFVILSIIGILFLTAGLNTILIGGEKNLPEVLKEEAIYSGEMTEDKLWLALSKVRDEKSDQIRYTSLVSFIYGLVASYPGVLYTEIRIKDFPDAYAKDFYQCWRKKSMALIEKIPQKYQAKALTELNKVKTPFIKYPGSYYWSIALDNLQVIYVVILFMVTFFAAATYSDSMEDGSMEIIYATKLGKKMMGVRLLPVIIYSLLLTLVATLGTMLILGSATGFQALKSSLKVIALFSIGNFTLRDGIILMFVSEILGVLALTTIMGWISYKAEKTTLATSIGIAMNIFYIIMAFFIKIPWKFFRFILNALPMASSQIIYEIPGFRFGMWIWRPYAVMINMILMFIVFGILLSHAICRKKIL
ncbi:hypothetical protein BD780_003212 [Clostridium tetanomorphum]|uniref:hypothetical protein n=1 Tax=Clostridium tetanomorphum TaxID=1553 RepID=UPI000453187B|nr:hypothetical protein [Clostridium tetanomorphum]KAJ52902.1 hypothetical protein CTM_05387 [Clostridium tetanomorphum DSM 665]NRS85987.1 hypothetical protein [Clostridium tetanomorphum]SQB89790.1 Uncharacterised protein [Clostridium tetanomorphum]